MKPDLKTGDWILELETRAPRAIGNFYCRAKPTDGDRIQVRDFKLYYKGVIHRPIEPTPAYNCHGLTFACRRTQIVQPSEVASILKEDGYRRLGDKEQIFAGDIAIYRGEEEITHSGIVVLVTKDTPWILSKWSRYHEAIHKPFDCPYSDGTTVSYYRLG